MSRIRSVHPGLWTDERFVTMQPLARLLFMGIWNECDDQGVFEWSPLKLKMRLLPADNADAAELLAEIEAVGVVLRYTVAGKTYGAVRSFTRFQRPKKPTSSYPTTPESVAFAAGSSEPVPNQFPTDGETDAQRKEEGGEKEGGSDADASGAIAPLPQPIDLKATVFNSGAALLVSKGMKSDRDARSLLGRLRSKYGDAPVIDALAALQRASPSDVAPYLVEILETRYGQRNSLRGTRPDPSLDLMRQGIAEERAERGAQAPDRGTRPALPAIGAG